MQDVLRQTLNIDGLPAQQVESVGYALNRAALRQRTYSVLSDVKVGFVFAGMVSPPSHNADGKPHISWSKFHQVRSGLIG